MSSARWAWIGGLFLFLVALALPVAAQDAKAEVEVAAVEDPFAPRQADARGKFVKAYGGTEESQAAVESALEWLALHQRPDGSWSFDHTHGPCKSNPGSLDGAANGATAMALLPFLGVRQTHKEGEYKEPVKGGLRFLVRNMKLKRVDELTTASLADAGTMYAHAMGTIVLCEAYAMTGDRELLAPSQAAINYVVWAQDPVGGGWRYAARQPGDTSVTGWQVQALAAGEAAKLEIPAATFKGAHAFLDSTQDLGGARYGYTGRGGQPGTTASGLYSRSLLGWDLKGHEKPLKNGIEFLASERSPSKLYNTYYTAQLLRHHLPEEWKAWNAAVRDSLVASQETEMAEKGSWFLGGDQGAERGGRLYCTSLAALILETPYRAYRHPEP